MQAGYEEVILVDTDDSQTGTMEKLAAHRRAMLHRAFSVFLINDQNQVLLQQRALSKYHSPGLWSNTCCSHPRPGESTADAAVRRLKEEMGITCELRDVYSFIYKIELNDGLTEHEYDHVFVGRFNGEPQINPNEVAAWQYMNLQTLGRELNDQPEKYTFWLKVIFPELVDRIDI